VLGLVWNLYGVWAYLGHVGLIGTGADAMTAAERNLASSMPDWATGAFAIAVFTGAIGALLLVLRNSWARPLLGLSLLAVIVQQIWFLLLSDALDVIGAAGAGLPVAIVLVAIVLLMLANSGVRRGWLR
jgi:hypothetical protein